RWSTPRRRGCLRPAGPRRDGHSRGTTFHTCGVGEAEREGGALSRLGLHPDAAAVALHDLLADRQPNARAGILVATMQPLEGDEDALGTRRVDAYAVVAHVDQPLAAGMRLRRCQTRP